MQKKMIKFERTLELSRRLLGDIQNRGLTKGDPYRSAAEAAEFLDVAISSANRSLQLLEKQGVLLRSQKKGATILNPSLSASPIETIHFLLNEASSNWGAFDEEFLTGIRDEIPGAHLKFTLLRQRTEGSTMRQILATTGVEKNHTGFILIHSSTEIQKRVAESKCPAVLWGTPCPGNPPISRIDLDYESAISILANVLLHQNRTKIAVVLDHVVLPSYSILVDTAIKLGITNFCFLHHRANEPEVLDELAAWLTERSYPDGIICFNREQAETCQKVMRRFGRSPESTETTFLFDHSQGKYDPAFHFPHIVPYQSTSMTGHRMGQLLLESGQGDRVRIEKIPVRISHHISSSPQ